MTKTTDGAEIAVLQTQMKSAQEDITAIKHDTGKILETLLVLPQQYLTITVFEEYKKTMTTELRKAARRNWAQNTISAALGIIFGAIMAAMAYALFVGRGH